MAGFLSRLFGGGGEKAASSAAREVYKGFEIVAMPEKATGGWRIGARIEGEIDGHRRHHDVIRADVIQDFETAEAASLAKARQVIDEQGASLFA